VLMVVILINVVALVGVFRSSWSLQFFGISEEANYS
jgi:hypothetical protein